MNWYRHIRIRPQLLLMYGLAALTSLAVGVYGIVRILRLTAGAETGLPLTDLIVMIGILVVGLALSVILLLKFGRYTTELLDSMLFTAEMLAVGNLKVLELDEGFQFYPDSKNEMDRLSIAYDKMVNSTKRQEKVIQAVARGDLTTEIEVRSENDLMGKSLNELTASLDRAMRAIITAAEQVASGASLVSNTSAALSQGATEQAGVVQELTASLEDIADKTGLNADNAEQASRLAASAKTNAESGNGHMKEMLRAMDDINTSSSDISKVIKVIDDIAFQTNILALNAAVEAARAGQHGKGFAVVAEEVRTLASKSANAAKETTDMIEGSLDRVETGTRIAKETAGALGRIVEEVTRAADLVGSIAASSNEQAEGIRMINEGIGQVSQVISSNAATSEESAAASEELSGQAEQLKELVSVFELKS